jgi:hypothetical protein
VFDTFTQIVVLEERFTFAVRSVYKIKENFFFLYTENKETWVMEPQGAVNTEVVNYEEVRFKLIKSTFKIENLLSEEGLYTRVYNNELIFACNGCRLSVCFLDSVEELSELAYFNTNSKSRIIYINKILMNAEEYLVVIYKDLTCELLYYDRKVREIKKHKKLTIMVEDDYYGMQYLTSGSFIIGYVENIVLIFDLRKSIVPDEKYVDITLDLSSVFKNNHLFYTNYFRDNFRNQFNFIHSKINQRSDITKTMRETFTRKTKEMAFKVTASCLFSNPENKSIYYIIGTDKGKIAILDTFLTEDYDVTPLIVIDYHWSKIEQLYIYNNQYLIASSIDGSISITEVTSEKISRAVGSIKSNRGSTETRRTNGDPSHLNYYYSKRKSLTKDFESMLIPDESMKIVDFLPIFTTKKYNKLKRVLTVMQIDSYHIPYDDNNKEKDYIVLIFEDNSAMVIDMSSLKVAYNFNMNTKQNNISAVYLISYEKTFIFYLDNNSIKVVNYTTKSIDRYIHDVDKIFDILRVDEKLKLYFQDSDKILLEPFRTKYDPEFYKKTTQKDENQYGVYMSQPVAVKEDKSSEYITIEYILQKLKDDNEKAIFMRKYFSQLYNKRKNVLNITLSKFESIWMKKIENYLIDQVTDIFYQQGSEKLKKVKILNLLFNPLMDVKSVFTNNMFGVDSVILDIGNQNNEILCLNLEDYFIYIEKMIHNIKISTDLFTHRINYFNFISLFYIWNLSIDQDVLMIELLKIYQPIFEFNIVLFGAESGISMLLTEQLESDGDFADHLDFFKNYQTLPEDSRKEMKDEEKFCNKKYIINRQPGYLTGLKNYRVSSNTSHFVNLSLFGSLIAVLGYDESNDICKLISTEKLLVTSLSQQKYIRFTNLGILDRFMYDCIDNISITNKDLILIDYLVLKYSKDQSTSDRFFDRLSHMIDYLNGLYAVVFSIPEGTIFEGFCKLYKEKSVDAKKLNYLAEYELSLMNIIITFNSIYYDRVDSVSMMKITQLLILSIFKLLANNLYKSNSKLIIELLSKVNTYLEKIYKENMGGYAKILIDLYTAIKIPIDLDGQFKKYELGNCIIIKSEDNLNFLKIMLAKLLKTFSKVKISSILKLIVEEFKKKTTDYDYFSYLLEILWILFREKNIKHVQYLPTLVNLIMTTMSPQNKDLKNICIDNAKKVLACLLPNYPMISFHQNSQVCRSILTL